jgi:hypothetical protein
MRILTRGVRAVNRRPSPSSRVRVGLLSCRPTGSRTHPWLYADIPSGIKTQEFDVHQRSGIKSPRVDAHRGTISFYIKPPSN